MFEVSSSPEVLSQTEVCGVKIQLLQDHSLWSHILFNSSIKLAEFIQQNQMLFREKTILELGSGSGLPSIVASQVSQFVTATDFPDKQVIENIAHNIWQNNSTAQVKELLWGNNLNQKFDVILVSDCIQVISEQLNLLETMKDSLNDFGIIYLVFQHHQPEKYDKVMNFFKQAEIYFTCTLQKEIQCGRQFPEDDHIYQTQVRENCFFYELKFK